MRGGDPMTASDPARAGRARHRRRRVTPRFFWMLPAMVLGVYLLYGYVDGFRKMTHLQRSIRDVQQQAAVLETRNEQLRRELARLESDEYIEMVARRELGLVMPGERAYVVVTEEAVPSR